MARRKGKGSELDEALLQGMGPGARLRHAREAKKITLENISETLRLSKQRIMAIESDDYSDTPALIYVRGRLRQYANLLGISPHEIIKAFDELGIDEPAKSLAAASSLRPVKALPNTGSDSVVMSNLRWWTFGLGLILLVLIIIGWREYTKQNQSIAANPVNSNPNQNASAVPLVIPGVTSKSSASAGNNNANGVNSTATSSTLTPMNMSPASALSGQAGSTATSAAPANTAAKNKDKMPQYESSRPE